MGFANRLQQDLLPVGRGEGLGVVGEGEAPLLGLEGITEDEPHRDDAEEQ